MRKPVSLIFIFLISILFVPAWAGAEEVLSWRDCIEEARKNNPDLIVAVEDVNKQKAGKAITASGLFPQINGEADVSRAANSTKSEFSKTSKRSTNNSFTYGVDLDQLIFDGFKTINDVHSGSENIKAAEQGYRFTSSDVRLTLRTAFVNLFSSQEMIVVAEQIIKIRKDNLDLISLRYKSGLEHKGALLTAEANLAEANFGLSQAKRNVEYAQVQLNKAMGRKELKPVCANGDFTVRDTAREKPDLENLVKNNPSLLQAIAEKRSAAFGVKSAYGNFFPKITGNMGADKTNYYWPPRNSEWNIGLTMSVPIFEGGLKIAQLSQAKALHRQTEANERVVKDAAIVLLEQTWIKLQDALETVGVQYKTLLAAQERSNIAQVQYSTGFVSFDNWIIIENDLVKAKKAYLDAQTNALLTEANWIQAKGETLEYE